jgi:hypothetical protein
MAKQILRTLLVVFLVLFPFLAGDLIGKFTPYKAGNSMAAYVAILSMVSLAIGLILFSIIQRYGPSFNKPVSGGVLLFLICTVIVGITGLAAPPDLSVAMLQHPEREHFRYILLFGGALLFGLYFVLQLKVNTFEIKNPLKWIMTGLFVIALAEMIWEFSHHYLYPEGLKKWTDEGRKADDFVNAYDNFTIITIGVIGRFAQFTIIMWLAIRLYQLRKIKIWSPILTCLIGLMGIISATVILVTEMHLPKGYEFLFLFFIPGIPFILLYWMGVALLTKRPSLLSGK